MRTTEITIAERIISNIDRRENSIAAPYEIGMREEAGIDERDGHTPPREALVGIGSEGERQEGKLTSDRAAEVPCIRFACSRCETAFTTTR